MSSTSRCNALDTPHDYITKKVFEPKSETSNGPKRPFRALGHSEKVYYKVKVNINCELDPDRPFGIT